MCMNGATLGHEWAFVFKCCRETQARKSKRTLPWGQEKRHAMETSRDGRSMILRNKTPGRLRIGIGITVIGRTSQLRTGKLALTVIFPTTCLSGAGAYGWPRANSLPLVDLNYIQLSLASYRLRLAYSWYRCSLWNWTGSRVSNSVLKAYYWLILLYWHKAGCSILVLRVHCPAYVIDVSLLQHTWFKWLVCYLALWKHENDRSF